MAKSLYGISFALKHLAQTDGLSGRFFDFRSQLCSG